MNGLAMARYGPRLTQDGATAHTDLLEAYLALVGPTLDQKSTNSVNKNTKSRPKKKTYFLTGGVHRSEGDPHGLFYPWARWTWTWIT